MTTTPPSPRLTVVEASAGTGKTHRITDLVAGHVIDGGVPIERILVVTFTRAATAELRDRIRRRLLQASHAADASEEARAAARRAVASFDLAAVTTIHGFCHQALAVLDGASVVLREGLVSDDTELRNEVVNDAVLAEVAVDQGEPSPLVACFTDGDKPLVDEKKVRNLVRTMLVHPTARLHLAPGQVEVDDAWLALLAGARDRVHERRAATGILTHDDVVRRARDAARADDAGRRELADRYQVVLVDEFQDTDTVQWDLIRTVFLAPDATTEVVVVGDPKQAIYSFRGADVHTYLAAREAAASISSLAASWRMEPGLIDATNLLFRGAPFGDSSIVHHDLATPRRPPGERPPRLTGGALRPEITVRVVPDEQASAKNGPLNQIPAGRARDAIAADVADTVVQLLERPGTITAPSGASRAVRPSDIAVLVGRHSDASMVAGALVDRGIRSVQRGTANVAESPAAQQWRWVLDAMQRPGSPSSAGLAALSWFVGWPPERLAVAEDDELIAVQEMLVDWRRCLGSGGVPAFLAAVRASTGLTSRLLARPDGERSITDLDHLGELLHAAVPDAATPEELLDVLDLLATDVDSQDERVTRRIDSDDDAVQLLTVHASKGLQFPITLVPFMWTKPTDAPLTFHEGHELCIDATIGPRAGAPKAASEAERWGTDARLLYVALTRAQHRIVVWWANVTGRPERPLGQLLMQRSADTTCVDASGPRARATADELLVQLDTLERASGGHIRGERVAPAQQRMPLTVEQGGELAVCVFERELPRGRARHSFSSLVAGAHAVPVTVASPADDETDGTTTPETTDAAALSPAPAPASGATSGPAGSSTLVEGTSTLADGLARLELAGTEFGTAMHQVFESVDFAAGDLPTEIGRVLDRVWPWRALRVEREVLVDAVEAVLHSPTGRHLGDRPLATVARRDRLDELAFELPLATSGAPARARRLALTVLDHLPDAHPLRPSIERLVAEAEASDTFAVDLRGHLTGSIDLVVRVPGPDGPRFVICDYKTNKLPAPAGARGPVDAYAPDLLWPAMAHHRYGLQAVLYGVALHRYLRWRLPGYRPEQHLGGAAYLFVRGMVGSATPVVDGRPAGVCSFDVPPTLTVALSDLLDGVAT